MIRRIALVVATALATAVLVLPVSTDAVPDRRARACASDPNVALDVTGSGKRGYTIRWCDGWVTYDPPKRRALRDCRWTYRSKVRERWCKRDVRTEYRAFRVLKRSLRWAR